MTKLEVEHQIQKLNSDFRSLQKALASEDLDGYARVRLAKLGTTILETRRMLQTLMPER